MLFFILLFFTLLCIPFYYISENFNDSVAFTITVIGGVLAVITLICGVSVLSALDSNTDLQTINKLRVEIMSLNEVEDKSPGVIVILNEKVSQYNETRNHAIGIRHILIMNNDKFTNTPVLVYDYDSNHVYEINEG